MKDDFREYIRDNVVLCDGGMGTQLYDRGVYINRCFDEINLSEPDLVKRVHLDYVNAGARIIETNTFGANQYKLAKYNLEDKAREINIRGAQLAREVAGEAAWVAGSIGPLGIKIEPWGPTSREEARAAFARQAEALLEGGVDIFMLETFGDLSEIGEAIRAIKSLTDKPIVAQMTITEDGTSLYGTGPEVYTPRLEEWGADVIGLNCSVGPHPMLETLEVMAKLTSMPLVVQPNAGISKNYDGRVIYLTSPDYFAKYAQRFMRVGAHIIGGCCGTTPEHIRAMVAVIRMKQFAGGVRSPGTVKKNGQIHAEAIPMNQKSELGRKISAGEYVFSLEITPARGWKMDRALEKAQKAKEAGFDAVNIPDGPRASARVGVMATAMRIWKDVGIEPILHYVCRDRNILGMQSDLLGLYSMGLANVLLLTGDPPVIGDYPKSTAVFDIDSIGLTNLANALNNGIDVGLRSIGDPTGFLIGVGVNPTAVNVDLEIERYFWKIDAGAEYAISQPVFDPDALLTFIEKSDKYLAERDTKPVPIIGGIWPLQSLENAEFLHHEVPGVTIPDWIMLAMQNAGSAEKEKEVGMDVAKKLISVILPYVRGLQFATPGGRVKPAIDLMEYAKILLSGNR
jgi:homocysteine S-methyltransferase